MNSNSSVMKTLKIHQTMQDIANSSLAARQNLVASISPALIDAFNTQLEWSNKYMWADVKASTLNVAKLLETPLKYERINATLWSDSLSSMLESQRLAVDAFKTIEFNSQMISRSLEPSLLNTKFILNDFVQTFSAALDGVASIDFAGIDKLDIPSIIEEHRNKRKTEVKESSVNITATSSLTVSATVTRSENITESEFGGLINKYTDRNGKLSLKNLVVALFETYVLGEALKVLNVIFSAIIAFSNGAVNAEIKEEIAKHFNYESTYRETRKIITTHIKVYPTDQVAFLREETYLRQGSSKNAPITSDVKVSSKSVLTIIDRRKNWLKVEVDTGESCGEIGWIQESKSIKFKKIN